MGRSSSTCGLALDADATRENPIPPELENNLLKNMEETAGDPEEAGSKGSAANKIRCIRPLDISRSL